MSNTLNGERWKRLNANGRQSIITDAMMVEVSEQFEGWANSVYKFGCAFIHLSNFHGYLSSNPLETLTVSEKANILEHMRHYHGGPGSDNPSFDELATYFPRVFEKIKGNLECYLEHLDKKEGMENVL